MFGLSRGPGRGRSRGWVMALAAVVVSAGLAGGCNKDEKKDDKGGAGGGAGTPAAAKGPDLSTPKSAAVAFAKAVQANDMAAAKAASTGNDEQYKTVAAMSDMLAGFKNYEAAAVAKFGPSAKSTDGPPDLVAEVEKNEMKVEGDKATLINKDKPDEKDPMKLVKKDGQWKVDLSSMGDEMKEMVKSGPKMRKALDDTAAEIKADKHKTADEAKAALGMKMAAAIGGG